MPKYQLGPVVQLGISMPKYQLGPVVRSPYPVMGKHLKHCIDCGLFEGRRGAAFRMGC